MALWKEIGNRLAWLFRRSRFDRELEDEIGFHIQARADELEQAGLTGAEAQRQARREFGPTLRSREETRSAWQVRWLEDLGSDLRYAARALRRDLALALAAVGSLALGIGANTTIFSVAREALFSQPSCRDPQSLVQISVSGNSWIPMSQYRLLEDAHAFDGLAGMNIQMVVNWRDGNRSYRLAGTRVTDNFFEVTGIPVAMGRPIERGESNVGVITHGFWTKHLGGDPNVVGRTLALDGESYTVVGVLPRDPRILPAYRFLARQNAEASEYHALLFFSIAGQCLMAASNDLIMVFIGLEISSIASYILAGYLRDDKRCNESALKYFLLGSFATAFFLYGVAIVYGITGSVNLLVIRRAVLH